jgi:hypothetical protein
MKTTVTDVGRTPHSPTLRKALSSFLIRRALLALSLMK